MTNDITTLDIQGNYEVSKLNAVQHGILSRHAILPWEESGEYDGLVKQLENEYIPQGTTEQYLVHELAGIIWRKARLRGAEKATNMKYLNYLLHHTYGDDTPVNIVLLDSAKSNTKQKEAITATGTETLHDLQDTNVLLNASNNARAKLTDPRF